MVNKRETSHIKKLGAKGRKEGNEIAMILTVGRGERERYIGSTL